MNEGFDSFQSVWQPVLGLLPEGFYYNFFALPLHWSEARGPVRVLVLGLGGGTAWRVLDGAAPQGAELLHEGVELDPDVVELAREHLDLPPDGPRHAARGGLDARVALAAGREPVQLAILDCYANQVEIPPHLVTVEFLRAVRDTLAPDGWLAANLGGFGLDDPLVEAVAATCAEAFEHRVLLLRVPSSRNFVLIARRDGELPVEGGVLRPIYDHPVGDLLRPLELPGGFRIVGPEDGTVLTDDFAPVERLQLASIREARQRIEGASR
ncbi:MAG: fused MFS/spermidine synthase [Planctomycetota bacterium]